MSLFMKTLNLSLPDVLACSMQKLVTFQLKLVSYGLLAQAFPLLSSICYVVLLRMLHDCQIMSVTKLDFLFRILRFIIDTSQQSIKSKLHKFFKSTYNLDLCDLLSRVCKILCLSQKTIEWLKLCHYNQYVHSSIVL